MLCIQYPRYTLKFIALFVIPCSNHEVPNYCLNILVGRHAKSWLIGKDSDAGRDWGQEEKGTTEDEMAGWHHWLDGRQSGWTPGVGDRQGGLACCNSWGPKESDTTEPLNWTELTLLLWHLYLDAPSSTKYPFDLLYYFPQEFAINF